MPKKLRDGDESAAPKGKRALRALRTTPASTSPTAAYSSGGSARDDGDSEHDALLRSSVSTLSLSPPSSAASSSGRHSGRRSKSAKHKNHQYHHHHHRRFEDLECGGAQMLDTNDESDTSSDKWRVLHDLALNACLGGSHIQVVHLKHANFGVRVRKRDDNDDNNAVLEKSTTRSAPTCMVGPHWWLMAATFTVFTGLALVITVLTYPKAGFGETIMGVLLSSACLSMYAMVACSNPGIVSRIDVALDDTYSYCDHCESFRPHGALHCMDCRVCIEGYDHHCPWTGKCVGRGNVRFFYAWLFFLVLAFVYEVIEFTTYMMPPEDQPSTGYYDDLTFAPRVNSG